MIISVKNTTRRLLLWSQRFTGTDMIYFMRGAFWLNANMFLTLLFGFVVSIVFANLLPKEQFGLYQYILAFAAILSSLTFTGMNSAITKAVARGHEGNFIPAVRVQIVYGFIPFAVAVGLSLYYYSQHNAVLSSAALIVGILLPLQNAYNTYSAFILGKMNYWRVFLFAQAVVIPYSVVIIVSLALTDNVVALVAINLGFHLLINYGLHHITLRVYNPNQQGDRSAIRYGKQLSLIGVLGAIAGQIDNFLVFHYVGPVQLASYVFATSVPEKLNVVPKTVNVLAFPKFAQRDAANVEAELLSKTLKLAILTALTSLIFFVIAPLLYRYAFPQYGEAIQMARVYSMMLVFAALPTLFVTALTTFEAKRELLIYSIATPLISLLSFIGLGYSFGVWGLIYAKGLVGFLSFLLAFFLTRYRRHESLLHSR